MTISNQRWNCGHDSYRPAGEVIRPSEYDVAEIPDDRTAKEFVELHHYSRTYPAARFRVGLHRHGRLVGVAVFSVPCSDRVLTCVFPGDPLAAVELGRFVLLDEVPGNGESWFLARCFDGLRCGRGLVGVVSFSDPVPRTRADGRVVFPGHVGTIFQAHNARYLGRGTARTLRLLPDGTVLSDRAVQKIRSGERGWRYAAAILARFGASPLAVESDEQVRVAWLKVWLERITRPLRHPGNHKYAWPLDRRAKRTLWAEPRLFSLPYPKRPDPLPTAA